MSPQSVDATIQTAVQHQQAGRLAEAERVCRQALAASPDNPDALHLLGVLTGQAGRVDAAVEYIGRAIRFSPSTAQYHDSLGKILAGGGKFDEAMTCFATAVDLAPGNPEGHNNLGIVLREKRKFAEAIAAFGRAIALRPGYAEAHYNLGNALRDFQKPEQAADAYRRSISLRPGLIEAHNNLANVLSDMGRRAEAIAVYRRVIELRPGFAKAHNNLGAALRDEGLFAEALAALDRAVSLEQNYLLAHVNRAVVLHQLRRFEDAIGSCRTAILLSPRCAEAFNALGNALKDLGRLDDAIASYKRSIELKPDYAEAFCALANLFEEQGDVDQANVCCERAISLKPDLAEAHNVLGNVLRDRGQLAEAIDCYRRAIDLKPDSTTIHGNLAYATHFHPGYDAREILQENLRWGQRHEQPILAQGHPPHQNDRSTDRRLKIGYVSPDFRRHPAACFILPLLAHHDPRQAEVFCYSSVKRPDAATAQCRELAHVWRDVAGMSDAELAERIRLDQIDVLVDLTLHMAGNRLLTFARKPAPVQVTWLGYPGTTGMSSIDYRLSDPYLDPPGQGDEFYSEKTVRLPHTFWCYQPPIATPDVNPLPALETGRMTFACFNHFAKVTAPALELWAQTLNAIAGSRMLILSPTGNHRQRVREVFERAGISPDRIEFISRLAPQEYFRLFHRVDLCLDPIPYPGHTSALDSLWMGVPSITLRGQTAVARGGASILSNLDLAQFIADTPQRYVAIAEETAADLAGLAGLRAQLRQRMLTSPLMNARSFAADMELAYRQMWMIWCGKKS
jgi:predicted O-linked N-acetylglucosamine transferase (SPINDLY family)